MSKIGDCRGVIGNPERRRAERRRARRRAKLDCRDSEKRCSNRRQTSRG
ncbi:hypothetical protein LSH36_26g07090 [Paralvinella palmiformis]|uniref:Uncharacterized protein n=1 Tax=Paralvinella palmiformis TaxID=53620 RepID=A0AAD9K9K5_9ANNE|nr:hypothetical protein LSH36_26g07090 [Paralvinella palmiformis]